jgi:hypothetical protein
VRVRVVLAMLSIATASLRAQSAHVEAIPSGDSLWIRGVVSDTLGRPIRGAGILVEPQGAATRSDSAGAFALRVAAGPAELIVRSIGYGALRHDVLLVGGADQRFEIELPSVAVVLDAFRVESRTPYLPPGAPAYLDDFYRRQATGLGRYFTREDIQRFGTVAAMLTSIPGVRTSTNATQQLNGVRMARCGVGINDQVAWFVDGRPVVDVPEVADFEIVAIEVYRGASTMPPEAIGNVCGAVYLWLRRS